MAVAGFVEEELSIQFEQQNLTVSGKKEAPEDDRNFLHQGIAARNFSRKFQLADHVEVSGARLENGLLHIELVREIPEAMKPKSIPIGTSKSKLIDVEKRNAA